MKAVLTNQTWSRPFSFIMALSLSYFYCLPLLRTGVVLGITASEIRLYDLVFITGFFALVLPHLTKIIKLWSSYSKAHKLLLVWLFMGLVGLFITLLYKESRFIVGVIRYVRFLSFSFIFILGFLYIVNRRQVKLLYDALLVGILLISIVGTLQGFELLPNFWPAYYSVYWEKEDGFLATAILAPNHTHYSLVMAIGIVMTLARLKTYSRLRFSTIVFLAGLAPMLYSMLASKGRSGWLVLGAYLLFMLIFSRANRLLMASIILILVGFVYNGVDVKAGNTTVNDILLYRSIATVKETKNSALDALDDEEKNLIQKLDDSRWNIYSKSVDFLLQNPQYLLIGAGFQNASQGIGGIALAAHNAYLNVLAEHGIIGFIVYVYFLYALFQLGNMARKRANSRESYFLATHWMGLYAGLLVANFFGEILYPGRALFTFLGTFFIITVVFLHPAWRAQPKRSTGTLERKNDIYHY